MKIRMETLERLDCFGKPIEQLQVVLNLEEIKELAPIYKTVITELLAKPSINHPRLPRSTIGSLSFEEMAKGTLFEIEGIEKDTSDFSYLESGNSPITWWIEPYLDIEKVRKYYKANHQLPKDSLLENIVKSLRSSTYSRIVFQEETEEEYLTA